MKLFCVGLSVGALMNLAWVLGGISSTVMKNGYNTIEMVDDITICLFLVIFSIVLALLAIAYRRD